MIGSLATAISALDQFQQNLNVTANNIANVNTVGYKSATVNFADTFSNVVGNTVSAGSLQVGTGVLTSSIRNQFTQGAVSATGAPNDLAISGNGFFTVKDPTTGATYATQDGTFNVDNNGYLVTSTGMQVQGYSDAGLTTLGPIKIDNTGAPAGSTGNVTGYTFSANGDVNVILTDPATLANTTFVRGQILLQNYSSPQNLVKSGNNLYSNLANAGPLTAAVVPGTNNLGAIQSGALELSNVDLAGQLASLIVTQRGYEANAKVISTTDQMLQDTNNLKQ
jgi:flagellar hook protein FlgE